MSRSVSRSSLRSDTLVVPGVSGSDLSGIAEAGGAAFELPSGVVPDPRAPGTMVGAGDSAELPGVVVVIPDPMPDPARTPEVSTPRAPTDRFASPATVSLMLRPARALFSRSAACSSSEADDFGVPALPFTGTSFNFGSIILDSPNSLTEQREFPYWGICKTPGNSPRRTNSLDSQVRFCFGLPRVLDAVGCLRYGPEPGRLDVLATNDALAVRASI